MYKHTNSLLQLLRHRHAHLYYSITAWSPQVQNSQWTVESNLTGSSQVDFNYHIEFTVDLLTCRDMLSFSSATNVLVKFSINRTIAIGRMTSRVVTAFPKIS